ncbi:hypothetical protein ACLOJK_000240 [Asimina triloba]
MASMAAVQSSPRGQVNGGSEPSKATAAGGRCGITIGGEVRRGTVRQRPLHLPHRRPSIITTSPDQNSSRIRRENQQDPIFVADCNKPDSKKPVSMLAAIVFLIIAIRPLIHVASYRRRSVVKSAAIDGSTLSPPSPTATGGGRPAGGPMVTPSASCRGEETNQRQSQVGHGRSQAGHGRSQADADEPATGCERARDGGERAYCGHATDAGRARDGPVTSGPPIIDPSRPSMPAANMMVST